MTNDFACYLAALDGWPFEVAVDLALADRAPLAGLPWRAHVRMELARPTPDGLCAPEERDDLGREEAAILALLQDDGCALVARVTHRGARTLVFHCRDCAPEVEEKVRVLTRHRRPRWQLVHDPEWTEFRSVLLPSREMLHQIEDRRVIREYEASGGDPSASHRIAARFRGEGDPASSTLVEALREKGFVVRVLDLADPESWLVAEADSPLFPALLDDFRHTWIQLALEHGAVYVGWSARPSGTSG